MLWHPTRQRRTPTTRALTSTLRQRWLASLTRCDSGGRTLAVGRIHVLHALAGPPHPPPSARAPHHSTTQGGCAPCRTRCFTWYASQDMHKRSQWLRDVRLLHLGEPACHARSPVAPRSLALAVSTHWVSNCSADMFSVHHEQQLSDAAMVRTASRIVPSSSEGGGARPRLRCTDAPTCIRATLQHPHTAPGARLGCSAWCCLPSWACWTCQHMGPGTLPCVRWRARVRRLPRVSLACPRFPRWAVPTRCTRTRLEWGSSSAVHTPAC